MNAFARVDKQTFLRFAASQRGQRFEYVRGRIVQQMIGGTKNHGVLARRIAAEIERQLDPALWLLMMDRGVETPDSIRFPDVVVEPADEPGKSVSTRRPLILVEILSPSTSANDLDVKPAEYLSLATLDAYVIASQTEPALLVYERGADGTFPSEPREVSGGAATVNMRAGGMAIWLDLASIYAGIV